MFLNNNTLKWKWIFIAAAIVAALCLVGIFFLDYSLYVFLRNADGAWAVYADKIFAAKTWLVVTGIASIFIFLIRCFSAKKNLDLSFTGIKKFFYEKFCKNNPAGMVFLSVLCASFIGGALKIIIGRMRPIFFETFGQTGFYPMTADWAFNSMPSGHTVASFAGLVIIGMLYPRVKWLTWTLAVMIGISRIALGAHFPSDVLLGAFIGMLCADVVFRISDLRL